MIMNLVSNKDEKYKNMFMSQFNSRSKSESTGIILTALGCLGIAGIQRFYVGHMGMGLLYLLTAGLFFIGTIIDFFKMKDIIANKNFEIANEIVVELDMMVTS